MTIISVPRLSKAAFVAALFLLSCQPPAVQKQSPVTPKTAFNNIPTLNLGTQKYPMPSAIKQKVLAKGLNPDSMTVVPRKELKTLAAQWQQRQKSPIPNANFAIQQLIPPIEDQVSCDWDTMNICGYENVGNWDEYYEAMYSVGSQEDLCVYEEKQYCAYSEDEACHISYAEMQFQGCDCPEGYEKNGVACEIAFQLKVADGNNENTADVSQLPQIQAYSYAKIFVSSESDWSLTIEDSSNRKVFEATGYQGQSYLDWYLEDLQLQKVRQGLYTAILKEGDNEKRVQFEVIAQMVFNLKHLNPLSVSEPITIQPPTEKEEVEITVGTTGDWLFEIRDPLNSLIWYRKGSNFETWNWAGTNQEGELLYSGDYTLRLISKDQTLEKSVRLQVPEGVEDVALYHDASVSNLLSSVEKRLDVMIRDTEMLVLDTQSKFPDAPDFAVTSFSPSESFRIKQQQLTNPPLPEYFDYISEYDVPKSWLDAQNDRIVDEVEILRQKVRWVESVYQNFSIQSAQGTPLPPEVPKLKQSFYGIDTTGGCYDYYNRKAKWKRKKKGAGSSFCLPQGELPPIQLHSAVLDEQLNIRLRGYIDSRYQDCTGSPIDANNLTVNFPDTLNVLSPPEVTYTKPGFEIYLKDFESKAPYINGEVEDVLGYVSYCSAQGCTQSNTEKLNLFSLSATVSFENEAGPSGDFQTQKTGERDIPPLSDYKNNQVKLDGVVRIDIAKHRGQIALDNPQKVEGTIKLLVKDTRNKVFYKPGFELIFRGDRAYENTTTNGRDAVVVDDLIHIWNGKARNPGECFKYSEKQRVPAGVYETKVYAGKISAPLLKEKKYFPLKLHVKSKEETIRITHECLVGTSDFVKYASKKVKEFRESDDRISNNPQKQPIAMAVIKLSGGTSGNLTGQKNKAGEFEWFAIPGPNTVIPKTIKAPEEQGRKTRRLLSSIVRNNTPEKTPYAYYDSERKLLEELAHQLDIEYIDGKGCGSYKKNQDITGYIKIFVDKETCKFCAELAWQIRDLLPRVDIMWVDQEGAQNQTRNTCY